MVNKSIIIIILLPKPIGAMIVALISMKLNDSGSISPHKNLLLKNFHSGVNKSKFSEIKDQQNINAFNQICMETILIDFLLFYGLRIEFKCIVGNVLATSFPILYSLCLCKCPHPYPIEPPSQSVLLPFQTQMISEVLSMWFPV